MGLRQIAAALSGLGYTNLRDIAFEGGHYEVEATDPDGHNVKIYVNVVIGKVLRSKRED